MQIKPLQYSYPDLSQVKDVNSFFETMKEEYAKIKDSGIFLDAKKPAIFIYRIQTKLRIHHGLIAGIDIEEYTKGNILKHENTLIEQEKKIAELTLQRKAIIKPVLLAYKKSDKINQLIAKVFLGRKPKIKIKFEKDDQIHELFAVDSPDDIKLFQKEFKTKIEKSYIADGHHRMSTISHFLELHPELKDHGLNSIMCALFNFSELEILAYNRLVHILDLVELDVIIKQLENYVKIEKLLQARASEKKSEIIMYTSEACYALTWKKGLIETINNDFPVQFDIDLFNKIILNKIFDIQDIRKSSRIHYIEGIKSYKSMIKAISENKDLIGFNFYPVKKSDFTAVADMNLILPPKSTWFEPRIRNGIIVQKIID
ncbi:MAG: DUF1015 domain-containing protein [Saprospiraceae bacterium]|nr:DUF1015 domain-containing protein [Saprospiraceae bacterium]